MNLFDRLCTRINPPMPDVEQARMLREVWTYREIQTLRREPFCSFMKAPRGGYWSVISHTRMKK